MTWLPIDTAPKDRIIKLLVPFADEEFETTGWWVEIMQMWTSGGMSIFEAKGWQEPTLVDGLRLAREIIMNTYCPTVDAIECEMTSQPVLIT